MENVTNAALISVVKQVNLHHLIDSFPQGLATKIGSQGFFLKDEQRQKIAIARAILRKPQLLIVDESSLALKLLADSIIQETFDQLYSDRTSLIFTNRITTIKNSAQLVVFNQGRIIESGTHAELLHHGNFYKRWYSTRFNSSQRLHQHKLVQKIEKKLARQMNSKLSSEISQNLDALLNYIKLIHENPAKLDLDQEKILDESYQSAQELLTSLKEYKRKITANLNNGTNIVD